MNFKKAIISGAMATFAVVGLASCKKDSADGLVVYLASTPQHVDPALNSSVDGATYAVHAFAGLVRYTANSKGELELTPDLAESFPTPAIDSTTGKATYTFKIREDAKFSDGTDIKASDFVKSWNRAASYTVVDDKGTKEESDDTVVVSGLDADYGYMFEVIDGYSTLGETGNTDPSKFLNVKATDDKTLVVTTTMEYPYFKELCAFPAYMVLKDADKLDKDGQWAKDPSKFVASGAYKLTKYQADVELVLEKNENYWDKDNIKLNKLTCVFGSDVEAMYGQYLTNDLDFVDDIPLSSLADVSKTDDYHVVGQLGTYYVSWNVDKTDLFSGKTAQQQEEIRLALGKLINRTYITESVSKAGETPATGFVATGLTDPAGGEFVDHNGPTGKGEGWFGDPSKYDDNAADAVNTLKKYFTYNETTKKFTDIPTIEYLINSDAANHKAIGEAIQSQFANYGINVKIEEEPWATFLETRKNGEYSVARNGWVGDYNDPISFLDMWTTTSGNNDCQLGKGTNSSTFNHYEIDLTGIGSYTKLQGTWKNTYDKLIDFIKAEKDTATRYKLMHAAETLLMSTGAITPIYNYVDNYLQKTSLENVYVSPLGYKYFHWTTVK